jgi:phenylalanine-4-hydroxylase
MSEFASQYQAKIPDANGLIAYTDEENQVWNVLYTRQMHQIKGRACAEFLAGLSALDLTGEAIPQLPRVSQPMRAATGWSVEPVDALISATAFFELLATQRFPAATFIRRRDSLDYVTEPDIFHELFGHCPLLVEPDFAAFVHAYAAKVLTMDQADWPLLQRFFWFTVEFGLINSKDGLRAYGGGILSSPNETVYSVESSVPVRKPFDPLTILRTPYRIDRLQTVYFVIEHYRDLFAVLDQDLATLIARARELGEFAPTFPVDDSPNVHIHCC